MPPAGSIPTTNPIIAPRTMAHRDCDPVLPGEKHVPKSNLALTESADLRLLDAVEYLGNAEHAGDDDNGIDPSQEFGDSEGKPGASAHHVEADRRRSADRDAWR